MTAQPPAPARPSTMREASNNLVELRHEAYEAYIIARDARDAADAAQRLALRLLLRSHAANRRLLDAEAKAQS